jgi:hypothetical protein
MTTARKLTILLNIINNIALETTGTPMAMESCVSVIQDAIPVLTLPLFDGNALCKVARLVDVATSPNGNVIGE